MPNELEAEEVADADDVGVADCVGGNVATLIVWTMLPFNVAVPIVSP